MIQKISLLFFVAASLPWVLAFIEFTWWVFFTNGLRWVRVTESGDKVFASIIWSILTFAIGLFIFRISI